MCCNKALILRAPMTPVEIGTEQGDNLGGSGKDMVGTKASIPHVPEEGLGQNPGHLGAIAGDLINGAGGSAPGFPGHRQLDKIGT